MSHAPAGIRRPADGVRGHVQIGLFHLKLLSLDAARGALVRSLRRANGFAYRKQCERVRKVSNETPKIAALGEFLTRLRAKNCRRRSMRRAIYAAAYALSAAGLMLRDIDWAMQAERLIASWLERILIASEG
jgi:hypothetical protein